MKSLSIAMVVSALMLVSVSSSADPSSKEFKNQKSMEVSRVTQSKAMRISSANKIQNVSKDIIRQLKKEVDGETPEEFIVLLKKMESDDKFSFNLTQAIGTQNTKEVSSLLMKATRNNMNIEYTDTDSEILSLKFCGYINGVKRCFPSQRNSVKCLRF
jgi:acid phosphatase class B